MSIQVYQGASMLPPDTDDQQLIDLWLHDKSENTRIAYTQDVNQFLDFLNGKSLRLINLMDLQNYADALEGKTTTRARKLASIKGLLTFGYDLGYCQMNAGKAIKLPKHKNELAQRILSEAQVIRMISLEENKRNHTLLRLLYHCGLRV